MRVETMYIYIVRMIVCFRNARFETVLEKRLKQLPSIIYRWLNRSFRSPLYSKQFISNCLHTAHDQNQDEPLPFREKKTSCIRLNGDQLFERRKNIRACARSRNFFAILSLSHTPDNGKVLERWRELWR